MCLETDINEYIVQSLDLWRQHANAFRKYNESLNFMLDILFIGHDSLFIAVLNYIFTSNTGLYTL